MGYVVDDSEQLMISPNLLGTMRLAGTKVKSAPLRGKKSQLGLPDVVELSGIVI
jgi:hypothetical protein